MVNKLPAFVVVIVAIAIGQPAQASRSSYSFSGSGVSASGYFTYEASTVVGDPVGAYTITGIDGTFSDSNLGLVDVAITGLVPIAPLTPPKDAPFPGSFSEMAVTNAAPPHTTISYDNLYYPGGSPITCPDYPGSGGLLDVYGLMFSLSNGNLVELWSNGVIPGSPAPLDYGVYVVSVNVGNGTNTIIDSQAGGVQLAVPEPGSLCLVATGLLSALGWRRRSSR